MKNIFTVLLTFLYLTVSFADQTGTDTLTIGKKNSNNKKLQFNKSGTPAEIRWNNSSSKIQFSNDGSIFTDIGSGGSFGVNFLSANPDAETNSTTGWSVIQDTAQATPACSASPSAGTNTIASRAAAAFAGTYTASSTAVLRGTYSFEYNKATATQIGEALTYAFTIAEADKSKPHQIVFDVDTSTAYAASDMGVYVCDGTTLITPSIVNIPGGKSKFIANFNASTSTSYKLVLHVQTGNTNVYNLKLDNFQVGPQQLAVGAAQGDFQSFPSSNTNIPVNGTSKFQYRRAGDTLELNVTFSSDLSSSTTEAYLDLPTGLNADTSKIQSTLGNALRVGFLSNTDSAGGLAPTALAVVLKNGSTTRLVFTNAALAGANAQITQVAAAAYNKAITITASIPISQWAGSANIVNGAPVECAVNTSTSTTANDTTSFSNDCAGAQIQNITAALSRTVQWQYPTQPGDVKIFEVSQDRVNWYDVTKGFADSSGNTQFHKYAYQNGTEYGVGQFGSPPASNRDSLRFGQYAWATTTYGAAGQAWSFGSPAAGSMYWRVRKFSNIAALALAEATSTSSGFVSPTTQTFGGAKTFADTTNGTVISKFGTGTQAADASNQGIVTTGTQTIAGAKTFNNTTNSTSTSTGAIVTSGGLGVAKEAFFGTFIHLKGNLGTGANGSTTLGGAREFSIKSYNGDGGTNSGDVYNPFSKGKCIVGFNEAGTGISCSTNCGGVSGSNNCTWVAIVAD